VWTPGENAWFTKSEKLLSSIFLTNVSFIPFPSGVSDLGAQLLSMAAV
jgi:hypothetical protein